MTTVIGIAGLVPETLEYYVILGSDTRGVSARTGVLSDVQKIFGNPQSNLVIAGAGRCLSECFPSKSELQNYIVNPNYKSTQSLENMFFEMDEYLASIGERNEYLAAVKEEKPKLYTYKTGNLTKVLSYKAIGSGSDLIWSFDRLPWRESDGRLVLSKEETIKEMVKAFDYIARKDSYTGGNMDFVMITPSNIEFMRNYGKIEGSKDLQNAPLWKDVRESTNKSHFQMDE